MDSSRFKRVPMVGFGLMDLALNSSIARAISNGRLWEIRQLSMTAIASSASCFVDAGELSALPALSICPAVYRLSAVAISLNHPSDNLWGFSERQADGVFLLNMDGSRIVLISLNCGLGSLRASNTELIQQNIEGRFYRPFRIFRLARRG